LLSHRLPVGVDALIANLIALNLSEGSPRKGKGATGRRGAVKIRTGVQNPLGANQAPQVSPLLMISMDMSGRPFKRMLLGSGDASGDVVQNLERSNRMK
jgi:hypothetical protein